MKRVLGLLLSLAFFSSFSLHGLAHGEHAPGPCAICCVSKSVHAGEAAPRAVSAQPRALPLALPAAAEPAAAFRLPGLARAPPGFSS